MKGSWKTTTASILALIVPVLNNLIAMWDADPATEPNWAIVAAIVPAAVGLFFARDNDKSSEAVGAK